MKNWKQNRLTLVELLSKVVAGCIREKLQFRKASFSLTKRGVGMIAAGFGHAACEGLAYFVTGAMRSRVGKLGLG